VLLKHGSDPNISMMGGDKPHFLLNLHKFPDWFQKGFESMIFKNEVCIRLGSLVKWEIYKKFKRMSEMA